MDVIIGLILLIYMLNFRLQHRTGHSRYRQTDSKIHSRMSELGVTEAGHVTLTASTVVYNYDIVRTSGKVFAWNSPNPTDTNVTTAK